MQLASWILENLNPKKATSDLLVYNNQESQSGWALPLVYVPFDVTKRSHWGDRGAILDFLASVGTGDILDFGPGDGWPSLPLAPFANSVTGVDASEKRVLVCRRNALRMGIGNASFACVPAGEPLPFRDCSFDGITAASSLEQSPDPQSVLQEFYRVLKPGGRLRITYESFSRDRHGQMEDVWLWSHNPGETMLVACDRDDETETALYAGLKIHMSIDEAMQAFGVTSRVFRPDDSTCLALEVLLSKISDCMWMSLKHAGPKSLLRWLKNAGFDEAYATHSGGDFGRRLFDATSVADRPKTLAQLDAILKPAVSAVVSLRAPYELDPPICALRK